MFEFMDRTVLDDLNHHPQGMQESYVRKVIWQVIKGIEFIHKNDVSLVL